MEDPVDDPWRGQWIESRTKTACTGSARAWKFHPLSRDENPRADNLSGVPYQRASGEIPPLDPVERQGRRTA